jgi:hypothetical protein
MNSRNSVPITLGNKLADKALLRNGNFPNGVSCEPASQQLQPVLNPVTSEYGLANSLSSRDLGPALRVAEALDACFRRRQ